MAPRIWSAMIGHVFWQVEYMKVRITGCPRYWCRLAMSPS